ncbi:hypothetical protein OG891_02395 [Streptomyces sp. NBC_01637]|nr:hypothetical protein [Streptomyces sp. NBC_00562]WTC84282.1 hypothetical protein OH719_44470 [Streptomyces sp. NBC_01653]WTD30997.1 hypothetical protein OHB03_01240 [Streptomyces sp. NBC_01643]WTD86583.1 hypothetical protein OG891_02395 [Streptomyces sp. NBC_01637]WUC17661.1 hypothetical protein OHA33_01465 [Streptomyces sp. NBC_00562]
MIAPTGSRICAEKLRKAHGSPLARDGGDFSIHPGKVMVGTHEAQVAAQSDREIVVRDGRFRDGGRVA